MGWSNQVVQASEVIISGAAGSGLFVYDPVPAHGDLITSIAGTAGTDPYSNAYPAGLKIYGTSGGSITIDPTANSGIPFIILTPAGVTHLVFAAEIWSQPINPGLANEIETLILYSGESVSGVNTNAALQLFSQAADSSSNSHANFVLDGVSVNLGSRMQGNLPVTATDFAFTTQTSTSASRLFKTWAIPAFDYVVGTEYRLTSWGVGTWNAVTCTFQLATPWGTFASLPVGAARMAAATSFMWSMSANVMVNQLGGTGIITGGIMVNIAQSGANQLPGGGANAAGGFVSAGQLNPVSVPTTGGNLTVQVAFGGAGASITSFGSILERIGPNF